ncbi:MAG: GAF and ANTAR domain-containing protein [Aeromicrobium sp.]
MTTTDAFDVATALTEAARVMNRRQSMEETLDQIVRLAVETLPEFDHVGVSVAGRRGRIETLAGTDRLVWELDDMQYALDEGPCVDAIRRDRIVLVEHAPGDQRWPRYMAQAAQRGLRAQLGLRLATDERTLGGLNLYSTRADEVDPESVRLAELFATHASIALWRVNLEEQLNRAVATRKVVGQAMGIVGERYRLTSDRAFQFLVRESQQSNVKLRDVAQAVVDLADERYGVGAAS